MAGNLWTQSKLEACTYISPCPYFSSSHCGAEVIWTLSYETCKHSQEPCCPLLCLPPFLCLPEVLTSKYPVQYDKPASLPHHESPVQLNINRSLVVTSHGGGSGILPF